MKHQVWNQNAHLQPKILAELKRTVTNASNNLDQNLICRAFISMVDRVNKCLNVNGCTFLNE